MANSWIHAQASARHFKAGKPEDFIDIHEFIDSFKQSVADVRHRAFLHNSQGPWVVQQVFGRVRTLEKWPLGSGKMVDIPFGRSPSLTSSRIWDGFPLLQTGPRA